MIKIKELYGSFVSKNKRLIIIAIVCTICTNLLAILIPLLIGRYYQLAFGIKSSRAQMLGFLPSSFTETIQTFFIFFGICVIFRLLFLFLSDLLIGIIGERLTKRMRLELFHAHMEIPMDEYKTTGTGKYLLRFTGDLNSIRNHFTKGILKGFTDIVLFIGAFVVIGLMSHTLLAIIIGVLLIGFFVLYALHHIVYKRLEIFRNRKSNLISFVNRSFEVIHSILALNKQPTEIKKFERYTDKIYNSSKAYLSIQFLYKTLIQAITYSLLIVTLVYGYYATQASISSADLLVTIMLIMTLLAPMRRLFRIGLVLEQGKLSWTKLFRVLNKRVPNFGVKKEYVDQTISINQNIELRPGLNFIPKTNESNNHIDKLLGTLKDDKNHIKIGNFYISELDKKQWRKNISIIDTRYPLIGRSVFEGISYSRAERKKAKAQKIISLINTCISPENRFTLDMNIGVNGSLLKDHELILLLYARAILARKPIVVINHETYPLVETAIDTLRNVMEQSFKHKMIIIFKNNTKPDLRPTSAISMDLQCA